MNENTEKLIRELAEKLGTTAEHLWSVLIRQAPITAITDLLQSIILIIICIGGGKYLLRWHKKLQEENETDHPGFLMLYLTFLCVLVITILCVLCNVSGIANALLNPEYWALTQIVGK